MEYKEMRRLIENIIENEFKHIQDCRERKFIDTDKEQIELTEESEKLFKQLFENVPKEYRNLLNDYSNAMLCEWVNMCRFYFKEGVTAGISNLEFIKKIDGIKAINVL